MSKIEIVPGERIGAIKLGAKKTELPIGTFVQAGVRGEHQGVQFSLEKDRVREVWIDDLREFEKPIFFQGKAVAKDASVDSLKHTFGPCSKVKSTKDEARYECNSGIQLGLDPEETGEFVRIRVRSA